MARTIRQSATAAAQQQGRPAAPRVPGQRPTAPAKKTGKDAEQVQVLSGGDPKDAPLVPGAYHDPSDPSGETIQTNTRANDGTETGPAYTDEDLAKEGGAPVERYEVLETKTITTGNGYRSAVNAGKIVDTLNFDISLLKKQNVKLRRLDPEEATQY